MRNLGLSLLSPTCSVRSLLTLCPVFPQANTIVYPCKVGGLWNAVFLHSFCINELISSKSTERGWQSSLKVHSAAVFHPLSLSNVQSVCSLTPELEP